MIAGAVLYVIASGAPGFDVAKGFASNGYGEHSPGGYSLFAAFITEVVMTAMFLFIIMGATHGKAPVGFAPLAIGLGPTGRGNASARSWTDPPRDGFVRHDLLALDSRSYVAGPKTRAKILSTFRSWRSSEKASAICSGRSIARDLRVGLDRGAEVALFLPGPHGVRLHEPVGLLAQHARRREIEQQLAGEDQAARQIQIAAHALRIDQQLVHQLRRLVQQIVGEDGRIGQDHALHGGVRDVALVPQRDILKGRLRIGAHHARQAADLLAGHRIALVRHRRTALLALGEILLGLAHFGALQMPHFERDLLAAAR